MQILAMTACVLSLAAWAPGGLVPGDSRASVELSQPTQTESKGTIDEIAEDSASFVLRVSDTETIRITVDEDTEYRLDDKPSTKERTLKVGRQATVTHTEGLASRVDAKTDE